jgi:hypothetical protein
VPFFSGNSRLKMVIDAMVGAYGLTFITMSVVILLLYVLVQLGLM